MPTEVPTNRRLAEAQLREGESNQIEKHGGGIR